MAFNPSVHWAKGDGLVRASVLPSCDNVEIPILKLPRESVRSVISAASEMSPNLNANYVWMKYAYDQWCKQTFGRL